MHDTNTRDWTTSTIFLACVMASSLAVTSPVFAQETTEETPLTDEVTSNEAAATEEPALVEQIPLIAEAGPDKNVVVGRNVLFDASASSGPTDATLTYTWDFGDGQQFQGIDASHIYEEPGTYRAKLTASDGVQTVRDSLLVSVAEDVVLMIVDDSIGRDTTRYYKQYALRNGTLLVIVRPKHSSNLDYVLARNIAEQLIAQKDDFSQASVIIAWTEKNIGLNALAEAGRIISAGDLALPTELSFAQKAVVRIDEREASNAVARLAQNTYNAIKPSMVLLTTVNAIEPILAQPSLDGFTDRLNEQGIAYRLIGRYSQRALEKIGPFNFLSFGINFLLNRGVSQDTIFLLLILPVVATIISFGRQIVGIKAFGIYIPSLLALTFIVTGLYFGLIIFAVLLATATLARFAARRFDLLYLPRMAIVLTVVSFAIFGMFLFASYFHQDTFLTLSIFPILVLIILTEKFVEVQIEQGARTAMRLTVETLVLAVVSTFIVTWEDFETFILAYPEVVLLTILINIVLGRFSGLRVLEYFRFRKLLTKPKKPSSP